MIKFPYNLDITHIQKRVNTGKYTLPGKEEYFHPPTPDQINVPCYYWMIQGSVDQGEPEQTIRQTFKVVFPAGTDIRLNDLVVINGHEYWLTEPDPKLTSHIQVLALRVLK